MRKRIELKVIDILKTSYITSSMSASELIGHFGDNTDITLDFSQIEDASAEFVYKIFVLWHTENPEVSISATRVSENLEKSITEALKCK